MPNMQKRAAEGKWNNDKNLKSVQKYYVICTDFFI